MSQQPRDLPDPDDDDDDTPWSEERWEAFIKRSDARSAKFGELFETFIDDPDRDEKIDREMGWGQDDDADDEESPFAHSDDDDDDDDEPFDPSEFLNIGPEEMDRIAKEAAEEGESADEEEDDLRAIPAYAEACEVGKKADAILHPLMRDREEGDPGAEELAEAFIQIHIAAAKLANGHGMGYEDEVLCGNIVQCKRALEAAEKCLSAWTFLRDEGLVPRAACDEMLPQIDHVRRTIADRIEELRKRVWW